MGDHLVPRGVNLILFHLARGFTIDVTPWISTPWNSVGHDDVIPWISSPWISVGRGNPLKLFSPTPERGEAGV